MHRCHPRQRRAADGGSHQCADVLVRRHPDGLLVCVSTGLPRGGLLVLQAPGYLPPGQLQLSLMPIPMEYTHETGACVSSTLGQCDKY